MLDDLFADLVAITATQPHSSPSFGSGWIIATNLVLTARHVVDGAAGETSTSALRVHLLRDRDPRNANGERHLRWKTGVTGRIVWRAPDTLDLDLALVALTGHDAEPCRTVELASFNSEKQVEVFASGFPRASMTPDGMTREYRLPGRLRISRRDDPLILAVDPADQPRFPQGWKGMSGATVLAPIHEAADAERGGQYAVFGVVREVPENFTGGQLEIAACAVAFTQPEFLEVLHDALGERARILQWSELQNDARLGKRLPRQLSDRPEPAASSGQKAIRGRSPRKEAIRSRTIASLELVPWLRRYSRALTRNQAKGDALVAQVITKLIEQPRLLHRLGPGVTLYRTFHLTNPIDDELLPRAALLLATVEGFSKSEVARILGVSGPGVAELFDAGVAEMNRVRTRRVMVVEDDHLIAFDLTNIVTQCGHAIVGVARNACDAIAVARQSQPELVLADVQLADSSSGIDAIKAILKEMNPAVIFITAYPERLLTGQCPEPIYLISKPFVSETVRVLINHALG